VCPAGPGGAALSLNNPLNLAAREGVVLPTPSEPPTFLGAS
jgi:hypothetical protein